MCLSDRAGGAKAKTELSWKVVKYYFYRKIGRGLRLASLR